MTGTGKAARPLFSFHGRARIDGSLTLVSSGPSERGRTIRGTWQTLAVVLRDCGSYLKSAPSCTFYW